MLRSIARLSTQLCRPFSASPSTSAWKIVEKTEGDTTRVAMEKVDLEARGLNDRCALCTCTIPVRLSYRDVLILEQFMREDGTVLPQQLTGLCTHQQKRLERCVMQAHWSGLFPDRTIPEFDRAGYKRFNRHWDDDMAMYRLRLKVDSGSFYYIKRYPSKNQRIRFPPSLKKKPRTPPAPVVA